jgi:hypothetical protein
MGRRDSTNLARRRVDGCTRALLLFFGVTADGRAGPASAVMHSLLEIYYRGGRNVHYMYVTTCDGMRQHAATSVLRAASHEIRHVCCRSAALPIPLCKTSFTPVIAGSRRVGGCSLIRRPS